MVRLPKTAILLLCLSVVRAQRDENIVQRQLAEFVHSIASASTGSDTRRLLSWTSGSNLGSFQNFMGNLMGRNWTNFVPSAWANPSFTWDNLGNFEYSSNMQDFLDAVQVSNITKPQSLLEMHKTVEQVSSHFCTPEKYTPSQKVFATCVGPAVSLAYVPKVCVLDKATHEVVCDPAKLVLTKSPGGCTHKYHSPSAWVGKECKISGEVGFTKSSVQGGAAYQIPLKTIDNGYQP